MLSRTVLLHLLHLLLLLPLLLLHYAWTPDRHAPGVTDVAVGGVLGSVVDFRHKLRASS